MAGFDALTPREEPAARASAADDATNQPRFVDAREEPASADEIEDRIVERAGLCADSVPPIYLDTWSLLNCQKPWHVSEADWRQALDDGGRFLDRWAAVAEQQGWTAGEIFDVPRAGRAGGLIWRLRDRRVVAYGPDYARLDDDAVVMRQQIEVGAWHPRPLDIIVEGVR